MTTTLQPIDPRALDALRQGNEDAFERLFRDEFTPLLDEAREVLGDAAPAARVVETTFLRAWAQRQTLETPEQLEDLLRKGVHEGALRARARRTALQRFESHEGVRLDKHAAAGAEPSVDEAWGNIVAALHDTGPDVGEVQKGKFERSRHGTATHMARVARKRSWTIPIVMAVAGAAIVVGSFGYLDRKGAEAGIEKALTSEHAQVLSAKPGQRGNSSLSDGSKVLLGSESRLIVPQGFPDKLRILRLEGSASFVTGPGPKGTFQVRAGDLRITATGTDFAIRAYPGEEVLVRVREGAVTVQRGETERAVPAGRGLSIGQDGAMREVGPAILEDAFSWTDGRFMLTDRTLRYAIPAMARWYGLELTVADPALLDRPLTMSAPIDAQKDAISALEQAAGVTFGWENKKMVLTDAAAAAPATTNKK